MRSFICYLVCVVVCFASSLANKPWAMPDSLLGFWPLNSESQMKDISGNDRDLRTSYGDTNPKLVTDMAGPFGETGTCHSARLDGSGMAAVDVALSATFTLSLYYYTQGIGNQPIFEFMNQLGHPVVSLFYLEPNLLEIYVGQSKEAIKRVVVFQNVVKARTWSFLALTYDSVTKLMKIYSKDGKIVASQEGVDVPSLVSVKPEIVRLRFGIAFSTNDNGKPHYMKTTDALACVMLYNTVLTPLAISDLSYHCQTKGQGTTRSPPATVPWPRHNALLGFWPLDVHHELQDVSPNRFNGIKTATHVITTVGPFGDKDTATKLTRDDVEILMVKDDKKLQLESFTVCLFFKTDEGDGGLFEFIDEKKPKNAFQFRYHNGTTIEVSSKGATVGQYTMVQQKGVWTFVAFTLDGSNGMFTVYGKHGIVSPTSLQPYIWASIGNNVGIRLGYASRWNQGLKSAKDVVSCLMVYSEALTPAEIRVAYQACRVMHGSAPCGTPKLPLSPIPSGGGLTTQIPKPGNFPYLASLRYGSLICSATIIDQFWLLSSSRCFDGENQGKEKLYEIYVGQHDLQIEESHTKRHSISKVIKSGDTARDIVLIELTEPIDFANSYVNDVCLAGPDNFLEMNLEEAHFVVGWGKNGRRNLVSQTLPRYVPGMPLSDSQCSEVWGDNYSPEMKDFCFMAASIDKNVPCSGDEGSPLLAQSPADPSMVRGDRLVQVGVYYQRDDKCSALKPGLFTNIAEYGDWISEKIACAVPGVAYPDKCPQQ